jgi:GDPmannose 4,6-dehydratase
MWLMLQQEKPEDFVLSTNETHSVREFVEKAFKVADKTIRWQGEGQSEVGICDETGKIVVRVDSQYYRPTEVELLLGDSSKARKQLNWIPKVTFDDLVREMVLSDMEKIQRNISM